MPGYPSPGPILLLILLLTGPATAHAQRYPFKNYSPKDGLSDQTVTAAIQDDRGLLWVGTANGVDWFDGKNFYEPPIHNTAGQLYTTNLFRDRQDAIWIMTFYNGIYRFADDQFTHFLVDSAHPESNANNVFDLLQLKDGSYICATDQNIYLFDGHRFAPLDPSNPSLNAAISTVVQVDDGSLLMGGAKGVFHYSLVQGQWRLQDTIMGNRQVNKILINRQGIWIATHLGLYEFNTLASLQGNRPDLTLFDKEYINCIGGAGADSLWVVTASKLHLRADGTWSQFDVANGLPSTYINSIYCDPQGISWFCSNKGMSSLGQVCFAFENMEPYLTNNNSMTRLYMGSDSTVWIGTQNGLIHKDRNGFHILDHVQDKPIGYTTWFHREPDGTIFAGTNAGILKISGAAVALLNPFRSSAYFYEKEDRTYWLADANGGVWRWEHGKPRQIPLRGFVPDFIDCLYKDARGDLWVGYRHAGIKIFRPDGDSLTCIKEYDPDKGYANFRIRHFKEDGRGNLLVGTRTTGLYIFSLANDSFAFHIAAPQGMKANWIRDITPLGNTIYMATNKGTISLSGEYAHPVIRQIRFDNDAIGNESGCLLDCGQYLYIANNGLMKYYPQRDRPDTLSPRIYFTQLAFGGSRDSSRLPYITGGKPVDLDYEHHTVSFQFAGIDLRNAEGMLYQYKLKGLDSGWGSLTTRNNVSYNLRPGHYTFRVLGQNEDGRRSLHPAVFSFTIHPPFWQTWWFLTLAGLALAWIIYTFYRYRLKNALKVEQLRIKISTDLHDDIGSTLSSISILSEVASQENEQRSKHIIGEINERSVQLMEKMDDIVWSINPRNDTVGNLLVRVSQFASTVLEAKDIDYEFLVPDQIKGIRLNMQHRQHVYLILKEAINNLIKYAECRTASIAAETTGHMLSFTIADDGIGFDRNLIEPGNGLANMQQRASAMGGQLLIDSTPGRGTVVKLSIEIG